MTSAWRWVVPSLGLGLVVFGGCGGSSEDGAGGGGTSSAGGGGASSGVAGTAGGGSPAGGTTNGGGSSLGECEKVKCGPQLGLPNWTCADGSLGGPTGRCLELPGGTCGWEINDCPMVGEGGASNQGGQGNAGAGGTGGASNQGGQGNAGAAGTGGGAAEDCGGCASGEICVFQLGGPGTSHFVCATQNPCGALGACACIVGQGTCQPNLMGDPPRYCSCDNGLD
jgi:hypothetical protein